MNDVMAGPGTGHLPESWKTRATKKRIFSRTVECAAPWNEFAYTDNRD
jgi:hypothetical protein